MLEFFVHCSTLVTFATYFYASEKNFQQYVTNAIGKANSVIGQKYCVFLHLFFITHFY